MVPSVSLLTKQPEQIHIEKLRTGTSVASVTALGLVTESQAPSKTARRTCFCHLTIGPACETGSGIKHHKNPVFHTHLLLDLCPKNNCPVWNHRFLQFRPNVWCLWLSFILCVHTMWGPTDISWFIIPSDHKYVHQKSYPIAIRGFQATYLGVTSFSDIWQWSGNGPAVELFFDDWNIRNIDVTKEKP